MRIPAEGYKTPIASQLQQTGRIPCHRKKAYPDFGHWLIAGAGLFRIF